LWWYDITSDVIDFFSPCRSFARPCEAPSAFFLPFLGENPLSPAIRPHAPQMPHTPVRAAASHIRIMSSVPMDRSATWARLQEAREEPAKPAFIIGAQAHYHHHHRCRMPSPFSLSCKKRELIKEKTTTAFSLRYHPPLHQ